MMYYASALTLLGGLGHTPLRSLMSKMVEPDEYGKIFTFTSVTGTYILIKNIIIVEIK